MATYTSQQTLTHASPIRSLPAVGRRIAWDAPSGSRCSCRPCDPSLRASGRAYLGINVLSQPGPRHRAAPASTIGVNAFGQG